MLSLFYFDVLQETIQEAQETSEMMDTFGWRGGWRIEDTEELDLLHASGDGGGQESRFFVRFPIAYVLETATMKVVAGEKLFEYDAEDMELDVLAEVQQINEQSN